MLQELQLRPVVQRLLSRFSLAGLRRARAEPVAIVPNDQDGPVRGIALGRVSLS